MDWAANKILSRAGFSESPGLQGVVFDSLKGLAFGSVVFGSDYVVLPPTGLYKPIWEYDAATLWDDYSAHLVYGLGTGVATRLLPPPADNGRAGR